MITIVHLSHFFHDGGLVGAFLLGKRFKMFAEMTLNFLGGKAANVGVAFIQRNVCQVVKVAEQADFGELRNTREHDETNKLVAGLDVAIKRFQNGTVFLLQSLIVNGLDERFVVFVHEDDDWFACFGSHIPNELLETLGVVIAFFCDTVRFFHNVEIRFQSFLKTLNRIIDSHIQVQMQNWIRFPSLFQF